MKLKQKIITALTTTILLGSHLLPIGNLAIATATEELEKQSSRTNNANVEFNTYLEENTHEGTYNITEGGKLYVELHIKENGYLKNGIVEFSDCNFKLNNSEITSEYIQKIENNSIYLKQINNKENITIELLVNFPKQETINIKQFSKQSKAKLIGTYVNAEGKEIAIEKEITNKLNWNANPQAQVNAEITKYIPYKIGEEYGLLVQTKVNSEIKENLLPIASTYLEVSIPVINDIKAGNVKVIANKMVATNGKENGLNFTSQNYEYDKEENKVKINVNNVVDEKGNMSWKNGQDEYIITCIYKGQEIYNYVAQKLQEANSTKITEKQIANGEKNINAINVPVQVNGRIVCYGIEQRPIQVESSFENSLQEAKGSLSDFSVQTINNISKGYIYANYAKAEKEAKKELSKEEKTTYEIIYKAQIYSIDLLKEIEFITNEEKLVSENNDEYVAGSNIITNKIKINERVFNKILGEEGTLQVLDKSNNELGIINSSSEKDEQGNYILNIEEKNINEIIVKASKPVTEGTLEVKIEKSFVENQNFSQEQMKTFNKILLTSNVEANTNNEEYNMEISLQEPVSKAEISIKEKQNLSTVIVNKDVNINIVLDTSSMENALYKNPSIKIVMPSEVKKVDLKDSILLLDDELKIVDKKVTNENGKQVINLTLEGTQTQYENYTDTEQNNVITKGANIILKTDLTLDTLASSKTEKMYMYYTNENTNLYENANTKNSNQIYGVATTNLEILGQTGVITANVMSGYGESGAQIMNTDQEKLEAKIPTYTNAKTVTVEGIVTNNYSNSIRNVFILGRLPFKNNNQIDTNTSLGSNFNMNLKDAIKVTGVDNSKVKIYYSTNGEATKDSLNTESNTWQENVPDYSKIKSYLIVIEGEVASATQIHFTYTVNLPENLTYNKSAYTTYKVYYNNQISDATIAETKTAGIVGLTTGYGPEVELSLSSNLNEVREGQIIKLTVTIINTGDVDIENAKLNITAPEGTVHTQRGTSSYTDSEEKEKVIQIGNIKPGETIVKTYELKATKEYTFKDVDVDNLTEDIEIIPEYEYKGDKTAENIVRLTASNIQNEVKSEPCKFNIKEGNLSITNVTDKSEDLYLKKGDKINYRILIKNIAYRKNLNNIALNIKIPNGVKINNVLYINDEEQKYTDKATINENNIYINVESLKEAYNCSLYIECEIESFIGKLSPTVVATLNNTEEYLSNEIIHTVEHVNLMFKQNELDQKYIKENTEYNYYFTVENIGKIESYQNKIELQIPEGLSFVKAQYTQNEKNILVNKENNGTVSISIYELKPGEEITVQITVKANLLQEEQEKEIILSATLQANGFDKVTSNSTKVIIEYDKDAHEEENNNQDYNSYKITGTAWLDENRDGKHDEAEQILSNIPVILIYKDTNSIVQDIYTGEDKKTITNSDGTYEFDNLAQGEYLVVFLYDASLYNITIYKADNVAESINSNATSSEIILEGNKTIAGVTDVIKITNSNIRDIDIGLYISEKFDLKLDKYISKITLTTPTIGTKVYNYNNQKLAKIEVLSKNVNSSSIIVEYKIIVTNEGKVPGYARKIIDYLPNFARFNTEINKDWYYVEDKQNLYNTSLAETIINPGESKEVKLILSYSITDKTVGNIVTNEAEIYESYNEQGLVDMDSVEANKISNEDDISQAEIVLSVATGKTVIYITLIIMVVTILIIGIYEINKRVLIRKEDL